MVPMDETRLEKAHRRLLDEIQDQAMETRSWTGRARFSEPVMKAMAEVPRPEFVQSGDNDIAFINRPLGIGHGQTISQPYMVALMTELLDLDKASRVLEIGAGSGYQAAVLGTVAGRVFTIEAVEPLATASARRLARLGYDNVEVRFGDGYAGWPEKAPFDAVMVTAAPLEVPRKLVEQMKTGGRMVIPIGPVHQTQMLYVGTKGKDGKLHAKAALPVAFVPMIHVRERDN